MLLLLRAGTSCQVIKINALIKQCVGAILRCHSICQVLNPYIVLLFFFFAFRVLDHQKKEILVYTCSARRVLLSSENVESHLSSYNAVNRNLNGRYSSRLGLLMVTFSPIILYGTLDLLVLFALLLVLCSNCESA